MPARPEVFISATSRDLRTCRQQVRDALLTLGCVPIDAEALYRRAQAGFEKALPADHPHRLSLDWSLSRLLQKEGKPAEGLDLARQAVEGARKTLKADDPLVTKYEQNLQTLQASAAGSAKSPAASAAGAIRH